MKSRKRHGRRRANRGTPSALRLSEWQSAGRCMRIPGQATPAKLSEWKRWFRGEGKYTEEAC